MQLDPEACYRALRTRDPRFDGRFFTGVQSTGIYCRPICPARTPKRVNCVFLPCAAAAQEAGFRPCLRCRPESSPGTPAWAGTSATVSRGLRLIDGGALDTGDVSQLAERLGVGERHLRRLFVTHVGASPQAIALTRRVSFAKQLIDETDLAMADIAFSAGFSSIRRFNDAILGTYRRSPRELRGARRNSTRSARMSHPSLAAPQARSPLSLRLPYRAPLDWAGLLQTLAREAVPNVAQVDGDAYLRTFRFQEAEQGEQETVGRVRVRLAESGHHLIAELEISHPGSLIRIADRMRRLFDLHADPREIQSALAADTRLSRALRARPGIRLPGTWDPFEFAVTTLVLGTRPGPTGRRRLATLVEQCGARLELPPHMAESGGERPQLLFPTPEALASARPTDLGLPDTKTRAVTALARAVANAELRLEPATANETAKNIEQLCSLPGVDEATAQHIVSRGLGDPDALPTPTGDATLRRALAQPGAPPLSRAALASRAERWRPWRGYAAMLLCEASS